MSFIPVNEPVISPLAKKYVLDCLESGWISSAGKYLESFEQKFAEFVEAPFATTVSNGTAALHLALACLDIGPGDEVIMPNLTIISCAAAALYLGAKPVLVDVDPLTGNINPDLIEAAITSKTKAIMVVHLYGHPCDMDPLIAICKKHNLPLIEDAAEAHGAEYKGKKVGSFGDIATFSFYANKIVTTGEGGMLVTNSQKIIDRARTLKNLAHSPQQRFFHEELGFNYRLTNLQAALGLAQLEEVATYLEQKQTMVKLYAQYLKDVPYIELPTQQPYAKSVYWMYTISVAKNAPFSRDQLMQKLKEQNVETRSYFFPLHIQPVIQKLYTNDPSHFPVSSDLAERGFYVPSGLALTEHQIAEVSRRLKESVYELAPALK